MGAFDGLVGEQLCSLLCVPDIGDETADDLTAIVDVDGRTVFLPDYYSHVESITTDAGTSLAYTVLERRKVDGVTYVTSLRLPSRLIQGTVIVVQGLHGLPSLPSALTSLPERLSLYYEHLADGSALVTSKSIEDVSVSYATSESWDTVLAPYLTVLAKYSLCSRFDHGLLSMPTEHVEVPWWLNSQDLGGGYVL